MKAEGIVGPSVLTDGSDNGIRLGREGALVCTDLHGKYAESSLRGNVFHASMTAGVILPAAAATAANPMTLANPAGSGKNLILISFDMAFTVINTTAASGAYGLYVNTNTIAAAVSGTAITVIPALVGTSLSPAAKAFSTSTVPAAPTLLWPFGFKITGGLATAVPIVGLPSLHIDFDGLIILTPGTAITPQLSAADSTNATVLCAFRWEEYPI